jgi:predicted nucleic acid-binding Zn ribbon protein
MELTPQIRLEARKELARRYFYDYCRLKYPRHYPLERMFLKDMCDRVQAFSEQNVKRFLIVNVPPRHYKSLTAGNFVEWRFGEDPSRKVMTGSYNEVLSTTFARKVRDTIEEQPTAGVLTYRDIFPKTQVKYGQASASKWALTGSSQDNYLATSPSGTATGFGANDIIIDDIIKSAEEAYSELVLEKHWSWFCLDGDTLVHKPYGDKELSDIGIGDSIFTYNHQQRIIETRKVVRSRKQRLRSTTLDSPMDKRSPQQETTGSSQARRTSSSKRFCVRCGAPLNRGKLFCSAICRNKARTARLPMRPCLGCKTQIRMERLDRPRKFCSTVCRISIAADIHNSGTFCGIDFAPK